MNSNRPSHGEHLDSDAIQALLDVGEGRGGAHGSARRHLANCAGCRARLDAWQEVFGELGRLRRFTPPGRLAERVMSGIEFPREAPRPSRAWSWLSRWLAWPVAIAHLSGRRLQDLADGTLSWRRAAQARAHLAACTQCEGRFAGWRRLMVALETLPSLTPSASFAEGVMARWRRIAEESAGVRQTRRVRWSWPRSPRGWAWAGALISVPTAAFVTAGAFVSSFPQLTASGLATYVWWQARDAVSAFGSSLLGALMQSGATFQAYSLADYLLASPGAAVAGAAAFTTLTLASVWVLHRNLGLARLMPRHVHT